MKTTILNGALAGDDFVDDVHATLTKALQSQDASVQDWMLRDEQITYCLGCFECWTKTPGLCRIDDAGRTVAASIMSSDLVIYLTPVTFGGYSSVLKKAIDRSICLISPFFTRVDGEVHHQARYERYPAVLAVGILPDEDPAQEEIFCTLVARHALNLQAPKQQSLIFYRHQTVDAIKSALRSVTFVHERMPL